MLFYIYIYKCIKLKQYIYILLAMNIIDFIIDIITLYAL